MARDFKRFPELTNSQMQIYYFQSPHYQITTDFRARVVKVTDGDTIRVTTDFRDFDFPIRFSNSASPELDEQGGIKAQRFLSSQILGKDVEIKIDPFDRVEKWGRLLGAVYFQGMSMDEVMERNGFAVPWGRRIRRDRWL